MEVKFIPELYKSHSIVISKMTDYIKDEPMLYGASWDFARTNGGVITNAIMNFIRDDVNSEILDHAAMGYHPVIDTKKYLLMPGMYRNIPGWHCDGVIRAAQGEQPDLKTINEPVHHWICSVNEDNELGTELITNILNLPVNQNKVWSSVDKEIEEAKGWGLVPNTILAKSGDIIKFNRATIHRTLPAKQRGWSFFFRLSFYHMPAMNEIREQVQVYSNINQGW